MLFTDVISALIEGHEVYYELGVIASVIPRNRKYRIRGGVLFEAYGKDSNTWNDTNLSVNDLIEMSSHMKILKTEEYSAVYSKKKI